MRTVDHDSVGRAGLPSGGRAAGYPTCSRPAGRSAPPTLQDQNKSLAFLLPGRSCPRKDRCVGYATRRWCGTAHVAPSAWGLLQLRLRQGWYQHVWMAQQRAPRPARLRWAPLSWYAAAARRRQRQHVFPGFRGAHTAVPPVVGAPCFPQSLGCWQHRQQRCTRSAIAGSVRPRGSLLLAAAAAPPRQARHRQQKRQRASPVIEGR